MSVPKCYQTDIQIHAELLTHFMCVHLAWNGHTSLFHWNSYSLGSCFKLKFFFKLTFFFHDYLVFFLLWTSISLFHHIYRAFFHSSIIFVDMSALGTVLSIFDSRLFGILYNTYNNAVLLEETIKWWIKEGRGKVGRGRKQGKEEMRRWNHQANMIYIVTNFTGWVMRKQFPNRKLFLDT